MKRKKQTKQRRLTQARKLRQTLRRERATLTAFLCSGPFRIPTRRVAFMPIEALRKEAKRRKGYYVPRVGPISFISSLRASAALGRMLSDMTVGRLIEERINLEREIK